MEDMTEKNVELRKPDQDIQLGSPFPNNPKHELKRVVEYLNNEISQKEDLNEMTLLKVSFSFIYCHSQISLCK